MTCIKYKVCSQYTVYSNPPQRPFISEDEILTYISGILQKKNYTKNHTDSSTHDIHYFVLNNNAQANNNNAQIVICHIVKG